jgi:DNA-binding GntR family transcriptional regulator
MPELLNGLVGGPMAVRTSEGIALAIRKGIFSGVLPPGITLPERKLAEELGVSRTPVREALFTLLGEGLVELTPGRCARVRKVRSSEIEQIYSLRRVLESHAARSAAGHRDQRLLERAEAALAAQRRLGSSGTAMEQAQADLAFHEAVGAAAGNHLLLTVLHQVLAVTMTYRSVFKYSAAHAKRVYGQHGAILRAIHDGDRDSAEELMAEHIAESSELALKHRPEAAGALALR